MVVSGSLLGAGLWGTLPSSHEFVQGHADATSHFTEIAFWSFLLEVYKVFDVRIRWKEANQRQLEGREKQRKRWNVLGAMQIKSWLS